MAITRSAKKAHRSSLKKHVHNLRRKDAISKATKSVKKLIVDKSAKDARKGLSAVQKALDKAVKMGTISKNTASRRKSRLSAAIKRIA